MIKKDSLTPYQQSILLNKGTDRPFTHQLQNPQTYGTFLCRLCGIALFRSLHQFASSCGWPSFDNEIINRIGRKPDADGMRTEIVCKRCNGHLGHVFIGENYTSQNLRHCVNQTSLDFTANSLVEDSGEIIVAGGCFWGIQHLLNQQHSVLITEVGYIGGSELEPNYDSVCSGKTGHYEAVRIVFDETQQSLEEILKLFFEIHDPFQFDGQGVDKGSQYKSAIFYYSQQQKQTAEKLCHTLEQSFNKKVATTLLAVSTFWAAEQYHQHYFNKHPQNQLCHRRTKRFK